MKRLLFLALIPAGLIAADARPPLDVWGAKSALSFEPNHGQSNPKVRYFARASKGLILFTDRGIVLPGKTSGVEFEFAGGANSPWEASDPTGAKTSYFVGRDQSKWARDVEHYRRLMRRQIYPGIDVVYYGDGNRLEYDLLIAPHADASLVHIRVRGGRKLSIDSQGNLVADTAAGAILHHRPVLYETLPDGSRRRVNGAFQLIGRNQAGFRIGAHDARLPLSIDPVLESSTYFGGSADDQIVYYSPGAIVGNTTSVDVPGATFAIRGSTDVFIQYATNTTLVVGGTGDDIATSAYSNLSSSSGAVAVGGYTNSTDLPIQIPLPGFNRTVQEAWQKDFAGGLTDGFVMMFNFGTSSFSSTGFSFSSYLGTAGDDRVTGVSLYGSSIAVIGTTNGNGLLQGAAAAATGFQTQPHGKTDGFLLTALVSNFFNLVGSVTYIGGSGDDTPLGVINTFNGIYVTGETNSPDFPVLSGRSGHENDTRRTAIHGASEAFVMHFASPQRLLTSVLFGGNGFDRGTAIIAQPSLAVITVVGATSSTDLPLVNPTQASYGGGPSDAFVAQFDFSLGLRFSTYLGGSDADEGLASGVDSFGNVFAGGRTRSRDFPVTPNALQPTFGGGPDDGFIAYFDQDNVLRHASYFGGSGSDRVTTVYAKGGANVIIAGGTTSPDLPLQNATLSSLKGSSDGFIASISDHVLSTYGQVGAKDLRAVISLDTGVNATVFWTAASSDPSIVQLAANANDVGQPSVPKAAGALYADCLTDSGSVDITLTSPGYPSRTVHFSCYSAQISALLPSNPPVTTTPATVVRVYFYMTAKVPSGSLQVSNFTGVRPGAEMLQVQVANSDSTVGTVSGQVVPVPNGSPLVFTPLASGSSTLSFSSSIPVVPDQIPILVFSAATFIVASGFQVTVPLSNSTVSYGAPFTATSASPGRILLTTDPSQTGTVSVTGNVGINSVYAQAIGTSGEIPINITVGTQQPFTAIAHIASPSTTLIPSAAGGQPITLGIGESEVFTLYLGNCSCLPLPNAPALPFSLLSSNPSVLTISPPVLTPPSNFANGFAGPAGSFKITAAAPGITTLDLQTPPQVPLGSTAHSYTVLVKNRPFSIRDTPIGKNLYTQLTVNLPVSAANSTMHFSIDNPSVALLSLDLTSAGQSQVDLKLSSAGPNGVTASIYLFGLAASGQAKLTASVTGVGTATATITGALSGIGWSSDTATGVLYASQIQAFMTAFALDPATLMPVATQFLRSGLMGTTTVTNSDAGVITATVSSALLAVATITAVSSGTAVLTINQPPGFTTPALRQKLTVTIQKPTLGITGPTVGINLQAQVSFFGNFPSTPVQVTVTSSDPSKLLISADPRVVGGASVTVPSNTVSQITLQALDSQGTVTITASSPTYNDGKATVALAKTGFGLTVVPASFNPGSVAGGTGQYLTTTQSSNTSISAQLYVIDPNSGLPSQAGNSLRAGFNPPQLAITSSQPGVGTINGSPLTFLTQQSQQTVMFQPLAIGQTTVQVATPLGFFDIPSQSSLTFVVSAPAFMSQKVLMARDTMGSLTLNLLSYVKAGSQNTSVTMTSPDPTRLLLAPDTSTPPSSSVTRPFVAGQTSVGPFYWYALANNGSVDLQVTAPGYSAATVTVMLTSLSFGFSDFFSSSGPLRVVLQKGPQAIPIVSSIVFPPNLPNTFATLPSTLQPGLNIVLSVSSSDPSVVSVDTPQLTYSAASTSLSASYRPLKTGAATLTLTPPAGYLQNATPQQALNVVQSLLSIDSPGLLGRDLQVGVNLGSETGLTPQTVMTVASSDPSRLLVSTDAAVQGQAKLTVTPTSSQTGTIPVFLQSLSDSGTVSVTVTSPGYQSASKQVTLSPSGAVLSDSSAIGLYTNSQSRGLQISMSVLDGLTLQLRGTQSPRAGKSPTITVTSSDPTVARVTPPAVQIPVSSSPSATTMIQPVGAGSALITLSQPSGVTPASNGQVVVNVSLPTLSIPFVTLGMDLQIPVQVQLAGTSPAPPSNVSITVFANFPLQVSATPAGPAGSSIQTVIPAGQRTSSTFYVGAYGSGNTASLNYSGGTYGNWSSLATVGKTAFAFLEAASAQSLSLAVNAGMNLTVQPALSPLAAPVSAPFSIRAGANPITITATSSNPSVLKVQTPVLIMRPGDTQGVVTVQGLAAGSAKLTLSGGSSYDFGTTQSSVTVIVQ